MRLHVRKFNEYSGVLDVQDIDSAWLNSWLTELSNNLAPATVNGHRQSIVSLLRFAAEDSESLPRTDRIRRQREPEQIKPAFTLDEIRTLVEAAGNYDPITERTFGRGIRGDKRRRTRPDGMHWGPWWTAFLLAGYESGQYLADLRNLTFAEVGRNGECSIVRHKTGKVISFRLSKRALSACRKLKSERLLPWDFDLGAYYPREFKKLCRHAGVRELTPKSIRRSSITYTYIEQGEEAARILAGHSSFATTSRHYIDWSIARRPIISPPSL